jgi:hypothetical protein
VCACSEALTNSLDCVSGERLVGAFTLQQEISVELLAYFVDPSPKTYFMTEQSRWDLVPASSPPTSRRFCVRLP